MQAIEHHRRRVRFFSTVELVNALGEEKAESKSGQITHQFACVDLVILDESGGYLPFSASGEALLFHPPDSFRFKNGSAQQPSLTTKPGRARVWINPRTRQPWETDPQVRKTFWLPTCIQAKVDYCNPYQIRHTYASMFLIDGQTPW